MNIIVLSLLKVTSKYYKFGSEITSAVLEIRNERPKQLGAIWTNLGTPVTG